MGRLLAFALLTILAGCVTTNQAKDPNAKTFGDSITMKEEIPLGVAMASVNTPSGKSEVLTSGKVEKVCQKKGCWMIIRDGRQSVRIKFKGYSFFVPVSLEGKSVRVQGILSKKHMSKDEVAHYMKDGGATDEQIAANAKAKTDWNFVASAVEVL